MKQPTPSASWPESWQMSYRFDLLEVFGDRSDVGYSYAYRTRQQRALAAIRARVPSGSTVLDIAAAQGNFSLLLAESGYVVTWNDIREELAGYVAAKHTHGSISYLPGNCFDLAAERSFDVVLATEIIEHVAHPDEFLKQVSSLVRPGGWVIATTPNGAYFRNRLPRFSACPDPSVFESGQFKPDADGHIFLLLPEEVERLAAQARLDVVELQLFTNPLTRGSLGLRSVVGRLPQGLVVACERLTSAFGGRAFRWCNQQIIAVLQHPRQPRPDRTE